MDDDLDLRHFSNVCRLFPLPRVVLFPHAVLPLHIFEPRYRQMTEDALAGDRLVTIVQLRRSTIGTAGTLGSPPIETVGCLGRVVQHERLPDGRFNFLLLGRKRVRLRREVPGEKPYRIAEAEILEDDYGDTRVEPCRSELVQRFREVISRMGEVGPELTSLLENTLPLGVLTDLIAHALNLPAELKQMLLNETQVAQRADVLMKILGHALEADSHGASGGSSFPPPFSAN